MQEIKKETQNNDNSISLIFKLCGILIIVIFIYFLPKLSNYANNEVSKLAYPEQIETQVVVKDKIKTVPDGGRTPKNCFEIEYNDQKHYVKCSNLEYYKSIKSGDEINVKIYSNSNEDYISLIEN